MFLCTMKSGGFLIVFFFLGEVSVPKIHTLFQVSFNNVFVC